MKYLFLCVLRPTCSDFKEINREDIRRIVTGWLEFTADTIKSGLKDSLGLVTNIKGLHMVREEALKVGKFFNRKILILFRNLHVFSLFF